MELTMTVSLQRYLHRVMYNLKTNVFFLIILAAFPNIIASSFEEFMEDWNNALHLTTSSASETNFLIFCSHRPGTWLIIASWIFNINIFDSRIWCSKTFYIFLIHLLKIFKHEDSRCFKLSQFALNHYSNFAQCNP